EKESLKVLERPDMREKLVQSGFEVQAKDGKTHMARVAKEVPMFRDIVAQAGIQKLRGGGYGLSLTHPARRTSEPPRSAQRRRTSPSRRRSCSSAATTCRNGRPATGPCPGRKTRWCWR